MIYKPQLIDRVWKKVNVGRTGCKERLKKDDIELIVNTLLSEMAQCMIDGEEINLRGFGKFASNIRKERIAFDSIHRQKILLPERRVIKFNISKDIDKYIRGEKKFKVVGEQEDQCSMQ